MSKLRHRRFGLTHPTWEAPACFYYDSAAEAEASMRKTYGDNSGHLVVEVLRRPVTITSPAPTTKGTE